MDFRKCLQIPDLIIHIQEQEHLDASWVGSEQPSFLATEVITVVMSWASWYHLTTLTQVSVQKWQDTSDSFDITWWDGAGTRTARHLDLMAGITWIFFQLGSKYWEKQRKHCHLAGWVGHQDNSTSGHMLLHRAPESKYYFKNKLFSSFLAWEHAERPSSVDPPQLTQQPARSGCKNPSLNKNTNLYIIWK